MPTLRKIPLVMLTLLGGLALWMSLNIQGAKAGEGATVANVTYGDPSSLMTPFSRADDSENYITFKYDEFYPSDDRLIDNLDATISDIIRLTPAQTNKAGSVFNKERVSLQDDRSFSTYFTFELSAGGGYSDGWADGLVFTVQTQSNSAASIGGTLGYNGITPSVGVKFDTWRNGEHGDPSNNHIAILKNGVIGSPLIVKAIDPAVLNLKGGTIHVWVDYDGPNGVIEVRLNKNSATRPEAAELSYTMAANERLTSILNSDRVYVGFTASTGGAYQNHDITSWYFTNKLDPIDIENVTYKQAPTAYTITPVTLEDGTVELTITPSGGDDDKQVALSIEGTDGAVIAPSAANTGEEGQAVAIAGSPDGDTLVTTITVTGPGGVASSREITIPGRTGAPIADNIAANATDGTIAVTGVPEGATVAVYDHEGNKLTSMAGVTGGEVLLTGLGGLTATHSVAVTFEVAPKVESAQTSVVPKVRSVLDASDVRVNATTGKAAIRDVPAGAVVRVYDTPGGNRIGEGTNADSSAAGIVVQLDEAGVAHKQKVYATIQATGELESLPVEVEALAESAKLDEDQIATDGTADRITVQDVPAAATIVIYDEDDQELGRGVNAAGAEADMTIDELGLVIGMSIRVTMIEADKLESEPVTVAVTFTQSGAPGDIDANATKSIVSVKDVPPGTKVTVYDEDGDVLDIALNAESGPAAVSLTFTAPRLLQGQALDVTLTEPRKTESVKVRVTAYYEQSAKPDEDRIIANATGNTVIVTAVKSGATITVYDENGTVILGSGQNTQAGDTDLTIVSVPSLKAGDTVLVTSTELYRRESDSAVSIVYEQTERLPEARIRADATVSRITFRDIPDGAEIIVCNDLDVQIASITNDRGRVSDLTVDIASPQLVHQQEIRVTMREPNKLVSDPTTAVAREQTAMPQPPDVLDIRVEAGFVKMGNVPPGATVIIYDQDDLEMGRAVYGGAAAGEIEIPGLTLRTVFRVTYTEPNKYESVPLTVDIGSAAQEAVDDAVKELEIGYQEEDTWESVTLPIFVVSVGKHNTSVSWTSGKPGVIEITDPKGDWIEALVHRQAEDESVILTAEVSKNGKVKIRTFLVIVKALGLEKTVDENYRQVKVTGGADEEVDEQVDIDRVLLSNGSKIDKAIFDEATAAQFVGDARTRNGVSRVYVDELPGDEPDEFAVEVPEAAMRLLAGNGNSLEVRTDYGSIAIDGAKVGEMADNALDLFFRLVPVKDANRQREINAGIRREAIVQAEAGGKIVDIIGASLKVETNYSGYTTVLTVYFGKNGIRVPARNVTAFLDSLRVYIEHSDGTKAVKVGTAVYEGGVPVGLSIEIDKFSTFSIFQLKERPEDDPSPDEPASPASGPEQVISATLDPNRPAILLELDDEGYRLDSEGFDVSVRGEVVAVAEVVAEGRYVTIRLNDPLPPGYPVILNYSPETAGAGAEPYLRPFSGLLLPNPGYHDAYISGFEDGTFRPDNPLTRAEIAAILARNMSLPADTGYQRLYPDVPFAHWAWSDIERLRGAGLLVGDTDGRFRPQDAITRAEMAMIAAKWLQVDLKASVSQSFPDVADNHWAAAAIAVANQAGVIVGFTDGSFRPDELLTRAQAVAIMNRLLGRNSLVETISPSWPDVSANHWAYREIEEASHDHYYRYETEENETWTDPEETAHFNP